MINSLFGVAGILGHWNLELALPPELTSVDPIAEEAWGRVLGDLQYPAFDRQTLGRVLRRHARGREWIAAAVDARDAQLPPPFATTSAAPSDRPALIRSLRPLLRPFEIQRFRDAVEAGDGPLALSMVSPGNRYLLARSVDGGETGDPLHARWALDQVAGMSFGRDGDYLGLGHPPAVPQGEVGDDLRDPHLYNRLLDIRVQLAIGQEMGGLPSGMGARLLPYAMARVLSSSRPLMVDRWRGIVDALVQELTPQAFQAWILDLAFADELFLPGESQVPGGEQRR